MDGCYSFAALRELPDEKKPDDWMETGLLMLVVVTHTGLAMTHARLSCTVIYITISWSGFMRKPFLRDPSTLQKFAKAFEIDCDMQFVNVITKYKAKYLQQSSFLSGKTMSRRLRHMKIMKFFLNSPAGFRYFAKGFPSLS